LDGGAAAGVADEFQRGTDLAGASPDVLQTLASARLRGLETMPIVTYLDKDVVTFPMHAQPTMRRLGVTGNIGERLADDLDELRPDAFNTSERFAIDVDRTPDRRRLLEVLRELSDGLFDISTG
jgi:hypothetical protein